MGDCTARPTPLRCRRDDLQHVPGVWDAFFGGGGGNEAAEMLEVLDEGLFLSGLRNWPPRHCGSLFCCHSCVTSFLLWGFFVPGSLVTGCCLRFLCLYSASVRPSVCVPYLHHRSLLQTVFNWGPDRSPTVKGDLRTPTIEKPAPAFLRARFSYSFFFSVREGKSAARVSKRPN